MPRARLHVDAAHVKTLSEALRIAASRSGNPSHRQLLNALDQQLKTHRPLGRDGVHGSLHTRTCGCVDKPRWWWLR